MKTGRMPFIAAPVETPIIPSSDSGVSKTRDRAEPRLQALRRAEHGGRVVDALAQHEHVRIVLERERQRFVDRLDVTDDSSLGRIGTVVDERVDESFIPRHGLARSL